MNTGTFLDNIPKVTKNLIVINVMVFLGTLLNETAMTKAFALFYPTSVYFHWWQPLTHMFMHGGIWHIFFNMYSLLIFGSVIERMIGERKFLIFYFACGFGAVALHLGVEYLQAQHYMSQIAAGSQSAMAMYQQLKMTPTVGASGAIYGLLIGYAMLFPQAQLTLIFPPVTLTAKWWVIIFAAIELFTGVTGMASGIAHFAHLGGMLIGFILINYWRKNGTLFPRSW
ncbi:MAG: rhomboid family intramembrane serine protease [Bacteroidales bacterium]|nr:rhomboid family intramembrane serine protease [Bacteroidales bacterium]